MSMDGRMVNVDGTQGKGNASEGSEGGEGKTTETSSQKELDGSESIEPRIGMEFESDDDAKLHYDAYARHVGFSTRVGQSSSSEPDNTVTGREFVCASKESSKRKNVSSCTAMLKVERSDRNKWVVIKFVKEHNHQTGTPNKVHSVKPRKHLSGVINDPGGAMSVPMDRNQPNHIPVEGNHSFRNFPYVDQNRAVRNAPLNFTAPSRKRTLGRDAQNLLDYFKRMQAENHGFFYAIQLDNDNHMTNVFWADARSRTAYSHFGDAVTFDTMYRWYKYRVPFAPFTGVNHHGEMILFGCALLLDESEASFIWLFKTFLVAMSDRRPVSITTDQDRAIQTAVSQVLPETRHRICKWHILREGQERLAHVCIVNPTFQGELYNCINLTETIEEFESSWIALLDKYNLSKHDWLQALYNARQHWVPVYFRNTFFGSIFSNQEVEKIRSFFDGYVNQETTLPLFFRQYERALENWFKKEIEADFDTICTTLVLKTPSPMEKQAANIYTKKVFVKFQEELVETFVYTANKIEGDGAISTYRVAKFEDDNKSYIVTFNVPEMRTSCSCQMFEFSGILCRHVLTVFTVTNILTLPSHYILKRWTRNARSLVGSDEYGGEVQGGECLTKRYNSLCQEAIKYAEEGAITTETYTVAMGVLREGGKKVSVMKKNIASVQPPNSQIGGSNQDDNNRKMPVSLSDISPLWPRQEDVTRSFNLNDVGAPTPSITDLNLPHMTPVSLHRDGGLPDNMVVLPCLKSMTWNMENRTSSPENRVAVIILKLLDYNKGPSGELEVKFQLSSSTLEPMLRSMAYINEQLSTPANRIAVINLKLQDSEAITGESEVKFQVSRDTLGAMLRSMAYIREQLSCIPEPNFEPSSKKKR